MWLFVRLPGKIDYLLPVTASYMMEQKFRKFDGLFITDLDGTLLTSDRRMRPEEIKNLERLQEHNIGAVVATGRSLYSFRQLMDGFGFQGEECPLNIDYVIFSTGAGIMDFPSGRMLQSSSLGVDDVLCISHYLERLGLDYMVHEPIPDTKRFLYRSNGGNNPDFQARLKIYAEHASPLLSPIEETLGSLAGATEVLCIADSNQGHKLAAEIVGQLAQYSVIKATSPLDLQSIWIEIFAPNVSKSSAADWLTLSLGLSPGQVCGIGNDYNDEDLLHWAGMSFVTGNGPQSLKNKFSTVASNNNGGVSEAIDKWLCR